MYTPLTLEPAVLELWTKKNTVQTLRNKNRGKNSFYFLQGPPYTSGKIHLGHAWNHALKDMVLRYKRSCGYDVFDRAGYDMHGLPTEHKTMAKHQLQTTQDIARFGFDNFSRACADFCTSMMKGMDSDLHRLGITLDFSDSYKPISSDFMSGVWGLIKHAHSTGRLYRGKKTMMWSPYFQTALAKHETYYETVTDTSIFVKFKRATIPASATPEYFVIWTTTPWTIPFNLAIMVNPDIKYSRVDVGGEIWIVASSMVGLFIQGVAGKTPVVLEELSGEQLAGISYVHPWSQTIPALGALSGKYPSLHTVLLSSEYVDTTAGTGLVHCAPGCGPEDFEVGHRNGLPAFNEVLEDGTFSSSCGFASGKKAKVDDDFFISQLQADGVLVATSPVEHEYPYDERARAPVIFRTTEQWFFKVEDLKEKLLTFNSSVHWVPQAGKNAFNSWLSNLRDNSITKQRFWGTPAPIWLSEDGEVYVVGSVEELRSLVTASGGVLPSDLHKPFIDTVTFVHNGKIFKRIPDVLDVWIDSGTTSFASLYYPSRTDLFERFFPADFICEGKDQIRGWFNLLMIVSALYFDKVPFKQVYMHGFIAGVDGQKMSKSLGNIISPFEVVDKYGADTFRLYCSGIRAGEDISFNWDEIETKFKTLNILFNVGTYVKDLLAENPITESTLAQTHCYEAEDLYMLSVLNRCVKKITQLYSSYELYAIPAVFEELLFTTSRTYIQCVREKALFGTEAQKQAVCSVLHQVMKSLLIVGQTIVPFISEHLYQEFKQVCCDFTCESVSHEPFVVANEHSIDSSLEERFAHAYDCIGLLLSCREQRSIGVRYPLEKASVVVHDQSVATALLSLRQLICDQTNCKDLIIIKSFDAVTYSLKPNYKQLKELGQHTATVGQYLAQLSNPVALVESLKKYVPYSITIGSDSFLIKPEYVQIVQKPDSSYTHAGSNTMDVYAYMVLSAELELEGIAREITRRIQSARKDAKLVRTDKISCCIMGTGVIQQAVNTYQTDIAQKCGIHSFTQTHIGSPIDSEIKKIPFTLSIHKL
jgi:isoleucyl-tRNA synthetase